MHDFMAAMGWVCIIEGAIYALAPAQLKRLMSVAQRLPDDTLRMGGLFIVSLGVATLWLLKH